jgi:hypothetical protein
MQQISEFASRLLSPQSFSLSPIYMYRVYFGCIQPNR